MRLVGILMEAQIRKAITVIAIGLILTIFTATLLIHSVTKKSNSHVEVWHPGDGEVLMSCTDGAAAYISEDWIYFKTKDNETYGVYYLPKLVERFKEVEK
ncbi:MAG: hypothetical protein NG712_06040 [Omnitrophica bacterium]|nr:hypothetical protein [Candidatus Omnitrophota bacterium]